MPTLLLTFLVVILTILDWLLLGLGLRVSKRVSSD